jgi:hypothetical protein
MPGGTYSLTIEAAIKNLAVAQASADYEVVTSNEAATYFLFR